MADDPIVEQVPLDQLVLDPKNPRKGDVAAIAASLAEFGQHRPAVVQRGTNRLIAGNHLVRAARQLGWDTIAVWWVDDDDTTATRRGLADNATGDRATYDDARLTQLVAEVGGDIPGLPAEALDKLLADTAPAGPSPAAPVYPLNARPGEGYAYVLVLATTAVDTAWLETVFDLQRVASYKSAKVGTSRAITVERFRELLPGIAATIRQEPE